MPRQKCAHPGNQDPSRRLSLSSLAAYPSKASSIFPLSCIYVISNPHRINYSQAYTD